LGGVPKELLILLLSLSHKPAVTWYLLSTEPVLCPRCLNGILVEWFSGMFEDSSLDLRRGGTVLGHLALDDVPVVLLDLLAFSASFDKTEAVHVCFGSSAKFNSIRNGIFGWLACFELPAMNCL